MLSGTYSPVDIDGQAKALRNKSAITKGVLKGGATLDEPVTLGRKGKGKDRNGSTRKAIQKSDTVAFRSSSARGTLGNSKIAITPSNILWHSMTDGELEYDDVSVHPLENFDLDGVSVRDGDISELEMEPVRSAASTGTVRSEIVLGSVPRVTSLERLDDALDMFTGLSVKNFCCSDVLDVISAIIDLLPAEHTMRAPH